MGSNSGSKNKRLMHNDIGKSNRHEDNELETEPMAIILMLEFIVHARERGLYVDPGKLTIFYNFTL